MGVAVLRVEGGGLLVGLERGPFRKRRHLLRRRSCCDGARRPKSYLSFCQRLSATESCCILKCSPTAKHFESALGDSGERGPARAV